MSGIGQQKTGDALLYLDAPMRADDAIPDPKPGA